MSVTGESNEFSDYGDDKGEAVMVKMRNGDDCKGQSEWVESLWLL